MLRVLVWSTASLLLPTGALAGEQGTPEEAQALLAKAVEAMGSDQEAALGAFKDPEGDFRDRDLYVFCFDGEGVITAHVDQSMLGTNATPLKDPDGRPVGAEMRALAEKGGGSLEYKWKNPVSGEVATKLSFLAKAGDQTCGVGAYQ